MTTQTEYEEEANKEVSTSPWFVSVLYGDYGSGKTTAACSMVKERGLLISSDDSWKVLLKPSNKELYAKFDNGKNIKGYEGLSQLKYIDFSGIDTVVWDTFSQSVDMFLDLLYDEAKWSGSERGKIITKNLDLKDTETLGFVDYRVTRDKFRPVLNRLFRETDAHIIFTSQMKEPVMGSDKKIRPSVPQATFSIVGTRADIIGMCRDESGKFVVDVTQNLTQLGKTRIEGIQGKMPVATFVSKYKETVFR
jgi:AAA domain